MMSGDNDNAIASAALSTWAGRLRSGLTPVEIQAGEGEQKDQSTAGRAHNALETSSQRFVVLAGLMSRAWPVTKDAVSGTGAR